jgi:gluconokinase
MRALAHTLVSITHPQDHTPGMSVIIMGVAGCGKSTLGKALSPLLRLPFVEGDELHPAANVRKMHSGQPLDDADRAAWLDAIAALLQDESGYPRGLVLTCSALKFAYRQRLRRAARDLRFLFLDIEQSVARQRLTQRRDHFMPASLVMSQFAILERPRSDENDIATLDASQGPAQVLQAALASLDAQPQSPGALE